MRTPHAVILSLLLPLTALIPVQPATAADTAEFAPAQIEWFEKNVRPLLVERCHDCHNAHRHENGLRLDSRAAILRGGDYGPVVAPGDSASKLLRMVRAEQGVERMPKKGQALSSHEVAILERWVAEGLPWPKETVAHHGADHSSDPANHWAFQPITKPSLPAANARPVNPIDALVSAKLAAAGLDFAEPADPRALVRRLHITLTGLQPTPDDLARFLPAHQADPDKAVAAEIDFLLASPQHGQRWARHWLDVARYADTEGYRAGGVDIRFPYSYTYRNWVIDALNADMPYDLFVKRQLAADLLLPPETLRRLRAGEDTSGQPGAEDIPHLAALGFLTVNDSFLGDRLLQIDDRIDVTTRGLIGLTVGCARCHNHKFDPVTAVDYYALYGVFNSSPEAKDDAMPVIGQPHDAAAIQQYRDGIADIENRKLELRQSVLEDLRQAEKIAAYMVFSHQHQDDATEAFRGAAGREMLRDRIASQWRDFLKARAGGDKKHPALHAWKVLASLPIDSFADQAPEALEKLPEDTAVSNAIVTAALRENSPSSLEDSARVIAEVLLAHNREEPFTDPQAESIRALVRAGDSPLAIGIDRIDGFFTRKDRERSTKLENEIKALNISSPGAPHRAMAVFDHEKPGDMRVMIRGNPGRLGDIAPRAWLSFFGGQPLNEGSGRLQLAERITAADNPLTARVIVNRVWMHHFGKPLVSETSDFGVQTPQPVQTELLDYLAATLIEQGWSLKKLHRLILNSRAWRQSSGVTQEKLLRDPDNELLSRMNRQRLDYETLRDNLLAAAADLTPALTPARPVPLNAPDADRWRSVNLFVDRYDQATVPAMFDFANPDAHAPQRYNTTVPQQALFLMNSPFMTKRARNLAARARVGGSSPDAETVRQLYRHALLREPDSAELELAQSFLAHAAAEPDLHANTRWTYGTIEIQQPAIAETTEDSPAIPPETAAPEVGEFRPFARYDGKSQRWSHTGTIPDPEWRYAYLAPDSGHAGRGAVAPAARWTSPADITIHLLGTVNRAAKEGDGIVVHVISSRIGILHSHHVPPASTHRINLPNLSLSRGEHLMVAFGAGAGDSHDSFNWELAIHPQGEAQPLTQSKPDFCGPGGFPLNQSPPLTALAQLAQVLLMSNEFQFLD